MPTVAGQGEEGDPLGDVQQDLPERRVVVLRGGEIGRGHPGDHRGDLVDRDAGELPGERIGPQRRLAEDAPRHREIGIVVEIPGEPTDQDVPAEAEHAVHPLPGRPGEAMRPEHQGGDGGEGLTDNGPDDQSPVAEAQPGEEDVRQREHDPLGALQHGERLEPAGLAATASTAPVGAPEITKLALIATTIHSTDGSWKKRESGQAAAQVIRVPPRPRSTATLLIWATCRCSRSRRLTIAVPRPNSVNIVTRPRKRLAIPTRP